MGNNYHPLTPLAGALLALVTAFLFILVFSIGNTTVSVLNNTNNVFVNQTLQLNNTLPHHFNVHYINFTVYGNYVAQIISLMAPILILLVLIAYLIYGGRR